MAQECARIMAEDGIKDFSLAKRKASERLGLSARSSMPDNEEIEAALVDYQRLFKSSRQPDHLRELRRAALKAMQFFEPFRPRLVGPVLSGSATEHSAVNLHVFADAPEDLMFFLMERGVPYELGDRRLKVGRGEWASFPKLSFLADDVAIELTVFSADGEREAPRSPVDGRPMKRAGRGAVQALIGEEA